MATAQHDPWRHCPANRELCKGRRGQGRRELWSLQLGGTKGVRCSHCQPRMEGGKGCEQSAGLCKEGGRL